MFCVNYFSLFSECTGLCHIEQDSQGRNQLENFALAKKMMAGTNPEGLNGLRNALSMSMHHDQQTRIMAETELNKVLGIYAVSANQCSLLSKRGSLAQCFN